METSNNVNHKLITLEVDLSIDLSGAWLLYEIETESTIVDLRIDSNATGYSGHCSFKCVKVNAHSKWPNCGNDGCAVGR